MNPRTLLTKFRKAMGLSQSALARELGCDPSLINKAELGLRRLGNEYAFRLEDMTQDWEQGPIEARSWINLKLENRDAR